MTQLDRLEALADIAQDSALSRMEWGEVGDALPDLIRVARAAKRIRVANPGGIWNEGEECQKFYSVIDESPLFSEVES